MVTPSARKRALHLALAASPTAVVIRRIKLKLPTPAGANRVRRSIG
jgi:hypothetical protein